MPTTSPDNLWSPESSDSFEDLVPDLATMQGSVQQAFNDRAIKTYKWDNAAARNAQTGMSAGDLGYQIDTGTLWKMSNTGWVAEIEDTGEVLITSFQSGWSSPGSVFVRRKNGVVYLTGRMASTAGSSDTAFILPVGFRPLRTRTFLLDNGGTPVRSWVRSSGQVGPVVAGAYAALDLGGFPPFPVD